MVLIGKKEFLALNKKIDFLTDLIKTGQIDRLIKKGQELDETKELLGNVKFKVRSVNEVEDQNDGKRAIKITYQPRSVVLTFNDNGGIAKDDFFYSMNKLSLISFEDMQKIQRVIDKNK